MKSTLVVLHGWGLSGIRFAKLVASLNSHGDQVLAPDFPGFGEAPHPDKPWKLTDYVQWLREYLKNKRIVNPVLIGHSFGGRVALKYQELYPKSVRALILSGTPGFTPIPRQRLLLFIFLAKLGNFLFSIPPLSLVKDDVRRWYYYVVGAKELFRAEGVMRQTFKNVVEEKLVSAMESVSVPCLLVWGELDIIVPTPIAEKMARVIEGSELVIIPEADHGVPFKQPEVFVSYVERFLKRI